MKRYSRVLGAALGLSALPLFLACNDPTGLQTVDPPKQTLSVAITPSGANIAIGETLRLRAVLKRGSETLDANYPVEWSSSDPDRVRISNTGVATGIAAGSAIIRAEGLVGGDWTHVTVYQRDPVGPPHDPDGKKYEPENEWEDDDTKDKDVER